MPQRKTQDVNAVLEGFSSNLLKSTTAPNIYRYEPMPEQLLFHQSLAKNRLLMGGNRGGKTFSSCADDVLVLLRRHPFRQHLYADEPMRLRFIGVDFERGIDQTAIPAYSQLIPPSALIDGSWEQSYRRNDHMLTLADGSTVSFMAYTQEPKQFQSVSLHHVHFDEEPPKPIFDESVLRVLDTNGTLTISETPVEQMEWIEDELLEPIKEGTKANWELFRLDTRRNIHIGLDALADLEAGLSEHEKIIRLQGQYDSSGTMVFPEFTRKYPHVVPRSALIPETFMHPHEWRFYRSMDYGFSNPTAWAWHAVHRGGTIITFELLYAPGIYADAWAKAVLEKDADIAREFGLGEDWHPEVCVGDPAISQRNQGGSSAGGASIQQAYAMAGVNIYTAGIVKTRTGNQNFGLDKFHQYLAPRPLRAGVSMLTGQRGESWWQITDNCGPLVDEMKKARKPKQTLKTAEQQNVSEDIRDKDNHAIDAVKYFFMATHELRPPELMRTDDDAAFVQQMQDNFHPTTAAPTTHREAFDRTMARSRNQTTSGYTSFED